MTPDATTRRAALEAAMLSLPSVERSGGGLWQIPVAPAEAARARAAVPDGTPTLVLSADDDDGWLTLTARLPDGHRAVRLWDALQLNGAAEGPARLAIPPGRHGIEIRADIPPSDGLDLRGQAWEACLAVRAMGRAIVDAARAPATACVKPNPDLPGRPGAEPTPPSDHAADAAPDLGAVLADAGWPCVPRSAGRFAVDLGIPGQFQQAVVEAGRNGRGAITARATVVAAPVPGRASLAAQALLLLTLSAVVRMVRGGAAEMEGGAALFFSACLGGNPAAEDLGHALSALAVACRMAARETRALADERIAHAYLAARGWVVP